MVSTELTIENTDEYSFEAYLCLLSLPDENGERVFHRASTTGRLVPLIPGDPLPPSELSTFQIGSTRLNYSSYQDRHNEPSPEENPIFITPNNAHPHDGVNMHFFQHSGSEDSDEHDEFGWIHSASAEGPTSQPGTTVADFQLFARDLLFADPNHYKDKIIGGRYGGDEEDIAQDNGCFRPASIEFLGNGCPAMGSWYSRAAIILWPHSQQSLVRAETFGGQREHAVEQARLQKIAREKKKQQRERDDGSSSSSSSSRPGKTQRCN